MSNPTTSDSEAEELHHKIRRYVAALASSGDNFRVKGEPLPISNEIQEQYTNSIMSVLKSSLAQAEIKAQKEYIEVTLGWMEPNRENLSVDEIIRTLQAQLKAAEGNR